MPLFRLARLRALMVLLATPLALPTAAQENPPTIQAPGVLRDFAVRALDNYIRPHAAVLRANTAGLEASIAELCLGPSIERLSLAAEDFDAVVLSWASVMAFQIEPLSNGARRERFFFWPDPRGITLRQVQEILAARDATATDAAALPGKSAAVQGIGALEYLLFGTGWETLLDGSDEGRFRCGYALAIGSNLRAIAGEIVSDLAPDSPFAMALRVPGPDNALFPTEADAAADLALSLVTAIEFADDRILVTALGTADAPGTPQATPLWRSQLTLRFAAALLRSAADFVEAADTAAAIPAEQSWLPGQIRAETDRATAAIPDAPIEAAMTDADLRQRVTLARVILDNIKTMLQVTLPTALGVTLGFNALDGDG